MAPILTYDSILDACKYSQQTLFNSLKGAEAFMDSKPETIKKGFFWEFRSIFRYFCGATQNVTDIFAETDTTSYFQKIPIDQHF